MAIKLENASAREMKVTTVRLGADLWALLDAEADRAGVSVSQYMREAALARAAFAAGARDDAPDVLLAAWAETLLRGGPEHAANTQRLIAALERSQSREHRDDAAALRAESRQARSRAKQLRQRAARAPKS
jgi:hypothetical protein